MLLCLAQGANPSFHNIQDSKKTPLHIAIELGHVTCAAILVHNRSEVAALDKDGWTPLHFAAAFGSNSPNLDTYFL